MKDVSRRQSLKGALTGIGLEGGVTGLQESGKAQGIRSVLFCFSVVHPLVNFF